MGALPSKASYTPMSHHHNILQEVVKSRFKTLSALSFIVNVIVYYLSLFSLLLCSSVEDSLVRNYGRSFNGFAAKLTESERDNLAGEIYVYILKKKDYLTHYYGYFSVDNVMCDICEGMEGVVSVFPSTFYKLLTTRSYEFMGLGDKSKQVPEVETNTIVGVIDGGIWPESKSFSDEGIGPIPKKWKGTCAGGTNYTCNKLTTFSNLFSKFLACKARIE